MNTRYLIKLYPSAWRERYEREFLDLLDRHPPTPMDVLDIAIGAVDARLGAGEIGASARRQSQFVGVAILMTLALAFELRFGIHDRVASARLGVSERPVYAVVLAAVLGWIWYFRNVLGSTHLPLLGAAGIGFVLVMIPDGWTYSGLVHRDWPLPTAASEMLEGRFHDAFVVFALASWAAYVLDASVRFNPRWLPFLIERLRSGPERVQCLPRAAVVSGVALIAWTFVLFSAAPSTAQGIQLAGVLSQTNDGFVVDGVVLDMGPEWYLASAATADFDRNGVVEPIAVELVGLQNEWLELTLVDLESAEVTVIEGVSFRPATGRPPWAGGPDQARVAGAGDQPQGG
jgi:hypothetical protein